MKPWHSVRIILTGTKLSLHFNIKDDTNKEHKHDLVYFNRCPSTDSTDNYVKNGKKLIIFQNFTLVSQKVTKLIIWFLSFLTKMLLKKLFIWVFWGQNVGPGWVKNSKKECFQTSHLTTNSVCPKSKVLNSHSLLTRWTN